MKLVNVRGYVGSLIATLAVVSSGCAGAAGAGETEDVGSVDEAFTQVLDENGLTPIQGAKVAVTAGRDHIAAVFTVKDAAGKLQIAGESFNQNGNPFGTDDGTNHPMLRLYSSGDHVKSSPGVAWDLDGAPSHLVVWQDQYSSSDNDVWGAFTSDDSQPVGAPFIINYDTDDERNPSVVKVRDNDNKWLVLYTRKHGSTTALSANWVSRDGTVEPYVDIAASGVDAGATPPSVSYMEQFGHLLFTWNNSKLMFADSVGLSPGTVLTLSSATGITSASNTNNGLAAIAWRDSSSIKTMTFPQGCALLLCATPTRTALTSSGGIQNPVIAGNAQGFGIFAGTLPASNKAIAMRLLNADGTLGATTSAINPLCGSAVVSGGALGFPGTIAATTWFQDPTAREYMLYAGYCDKSPLNSKIQAAAPLFSTNSPLVFNITN